MLALPNYLGGLGIFYPQKSSEDSLVSVTFPLAAAIINQNSFDCANLHRQRDLKQEALSIKH